MPQSATGNRSEKKRGTDLPDLVFTGISSLVIAFYLELFREAVNSFRDGDAIGLLSLSFTTSSAICIAAAFAATFAVLALLQAKTKIVKRLIAWRYPIALAVFIALVALQVSGSSIALWGSLIGGSPNGDLEGVVFGIPRTIRSDEFVVFTPMAFSQEATGYAAVSDIMRGVPTDVTMVYAQPCWSIATLFRPFLWGYLAFGSAYGLSIFWCGRLIVLMLVSFEFGRLVSRDNHVMALSYALMVSLAPVVQWWFSVNGIAELLIFAQAGLLAFRAFLRTPALPRRIAMAAGAAYSAGCFVMVIYPAWQVGLAYLIVALCAADVFSCRKERVGAFAPGMGMRKALVSYWLVLLCALAVAGVLIGIALVSSIDAIQAVRNTVYPGQRIETGGQFAPLMMDWAGSWLYPLAFEHAVPNACERASFFSLFPLGIAFAIAALRRRSNPYLVALLIAQAILFAYGIVGFPEWLAKITLLSNVPSSRLQLAVGLCDTLLLVMGATELRETERGEADDKRKTAMRVAVPVALGAIAAASTQALHPSFAFKVFLVFIAVFAALAAYAFLAFACGRGGTRKIACVAAALAIAGLCVNPVQQGISALAGDELLGRASAIAEQDPDATWAGDDGLPAQALLASGVRTINSVATYPDLETWRKLDPSGAYEDIYNRYAHIEIEPTRSITAFELRHPDEFVLKLNVDDIPKLGIDYWLSAKDLTAFNTDRVTFTPLDSNGMWTIYQIE